MALVKIKAILYFVEADGNISGIKWEPKQFALFDVLISSFSIKHSTTHGQVYPVFPLSTTVPPAASDH